MNHPSQARSTYTVDFDRKSAQRPTHRDTGRIPRVVRVLVLAHQIEALIGTGALTDLADAARRLGLTRARVTQITNLLLLAPEIQEAILELPPVTNGRDPVSERAVRQIVAESDWTKQRSLWDEVNR